METFTLGGDPSSIRASARLWGNFSTTASGASSDIKSVNTTEWVGDESEVYRGRIHKDLVPHLDVTAEAWGIVKTALNVYAGHLESLQSRMSTLRIQHAHQQTVVRNAQTGYVAAKAADKSHHDGRRRAIDNRTEGQTLPADTYLAQSGGAFSRLQTAQQTLQGLQTKAGAIRIEHAKYVRACCDEIGRAKKLRPVHPPGWRDALKTWVGDRWNDVKSGVAWAAEHLGPILKVISAVAGMLALIPCLAPIMGPIALVAGGAALALDIMNKLMNGKGSWLQIGLDTLALVPGIKPLTTAGKLGKMASATRGVEQTSSMVSRANRALTAAKASGHGIKDAKSALSAARALNMSKYSQLAALTSKYKKIDNIWKGVDAATTVTTTGLTTYKTYRDTGSWKQALLVGAVSSLGTKIPGAGRRFTAVQNVVNTAGSTLYTATGMLLDPKKFNDPMQWVKLTTGVGKFGIHGYNGSTYQTAGTHPNGSARAAYELPSYWG